MVNQIVREMTAPKSMGKTSDTLQENSAAGFEQILEEELAKIPQPEQLPVDKAMLFYQPLHNIITPVSKTDILAGTMQVEVQADTPVVSQAVVSEQVQENLAEILPKQNGNKDMRVDPTQSQTDVLQEGIQPEVTAKHEHRITEPVTKNTTDTTNTTENAVILQADTAMGTTTNVTATEKSMSAKEPTTDYVASTPDKLNEHVTKMIQSGKRQIEIQLQPEHLGKLVIKASYDAGKAMVAIVCTDTKTMNIMNQNASELAEIIAARTGRPTEVVVDNAPVDYLEQQSQNQQEREGTKQDQRGNRDKKQSGTTDFLQHLRLGLV